MESLLSRKFILTVLSLVAVTVLLIVGKISQEVFQLVLMVALGIYTTGNVTSKFADK